MEKIKNALYLIAVGAAMTVYAHSAFAPASIEKRLEIMDERIYDIHQAIVGKCE